MLRWIGTKSAEMTVIMSFCGYQLKKNEYYIDQGIGKPLKEIFCPKAFLEQHLIWNIKEKEILPKQDFVNFCVATFAIDKDAIHIGETCAILIPVKILEYTPESSN